MTRLAMADPATLPPYLMTMHDRAAPGDWATRHTARVFASHPDLLERFHMFYVPLHRNAGAGVLETRVAELVRLRVATLNGCVACKTARLDPANVSEQEASRDVDAAEAAGFSPRERAALAFAETMACDHFAVDEVMIAELRRHFSQAELLELMVMTGQYIGFGRVAAILHLEEATCPI